MTLILGLETSCDETAAAVVRDGRLVLSSVVASQNELHERYRGVVPEIASRAHLERITPVVEETVRAAGVGWNDIEAVAVGNRPGLIGSLLVGVSAGKALAWALGRPIVGVDHVQAHLHAAALGESSPQPEFPALGLVISGGHTSLYEVASPTSMHAIGRTIDDAVGEAYDKAAVILGVPYPGGPNLDRLAQAGDASRHKLPRSLLDDESLDFSFSGLKTALLYKVRGIPRGRGREAVFERSIGDLSPADRADMAAAFQTTAVETLITKMVRALEQMSRAGRPARCVIIGGGVCANSLLRRRAGELGASRGLPVLLPAMGYCVDNAAMIAGLAYHHLRAGRVDDLHLPAVATTSLR
ncbi:MAG: tRNA (adenosine(37)-N6)-threonylcarbamoyltransferase complex transferase subunit TsaD [Planctomycetes bacterium]|nr:tRNA (adenosine(37)-N6)-threonylcarbamoyltransferase complex transferase subunit TsaD [Planctomycetota bacterium]